MPFTLLNSLVHHFDETHECNSVQQHSESPGKLPTRLIDISRDDTEPMRLVETRQQPSITRRYVALSHRWGDHSPDQRSELESLAMSTKASAAEVWVHPFLCSLVSAHTSTTSCSGRSASRIKSFPQASRVLSWRIIFFTSTQVQ